MKSWDKRKQIDCFGNTKPESIDHVWPRDKAGSNDKVNKMILSLQSNNEKGNRTKGVINGIRFSVVRAIDKKGNIYGRMQIKKNDVWEWVEPVL